MKKPPLSLLAIAALLAGCTVSDGAPSANPLTGDAPEGFEEYYSQVVEFSPCEADQVTADLTPTPKDLNNYWCATVTAPTDWDDPDSEAIELGVGYYRSSNASAGDASSDRGLLFFNLGGPGGDAVNSLSIVREQILPADVIGAYDLLALDPRGVGESTPVTCWDDAGRDEFFADSEPTPEDATLDELVADASSEVAELGAKCLERSGDVLGFVDTDSAARDFDMVRALLGQERMDYVGYSYGTALGAVYADRFPDHVGRFVLDGALDPAFDINRVSALQAQGMEEALYRWIETCQQADACPLAGDLEDGKQQMIDFLAAIADEPLPTNDPARPLTESLARTGIIGSLYSEDSYEYLSMGMTMALEGDGSVLLVLADLYNNRNSDGSYGNMQDAFLAVNFLDYEPVGTPQEWQAQADHIAESYPVLGEGFGFPSAGLDAWPVRARVARAGVTAAGAAPILVVGTTNDPATPYVMAQSLAESLESGVLLTYDGWGHGAYQAGGNQCVLDAVNAYLLSGEVPEAGTVCAE